MFHSSQNSVGTIQTNPVSLPRYEFVPGTAWDEIGDATRSHANYQASLVRDIYGNPFRSVIFDTAWRSTTTIGLAETMYASRDFAAMPILADALEEAGCYNTAVLAHCRGPGPHVRGCWVVDLVLGKA
jgi:hypothetical protein